MTSPTAPQGVSSSLELLSVKIGWVLLRLSTMHFFDVYVISKLRRSGLVDRLFPPADPGVPAS